MMRFMGSRGLIALVQGLALVAAPMTATAAPLHVTSLVLAAAPAAGVPEGFAGARKAGDRYAKDGDDTAALEAWRVAYGRAPEGAKGDEARETLLLDIGRAERRLYESSQDPACLRRAEPALQGYLAANATRTGDDEKAAAQRAEVERELEEIRSRLAVIDKPPEPEPVPPPPVVAPAPPPLAPPDPVLMDQRRRANAMVAAGGVFVGLGGISLVLLAMPATIAGAIADDRADNSPILVSESELRGRADRRFFFAKVAALAGLGSAALGGVLLGVGLSRRKRIDSDIQDQQRRPQAHVSPYFSPDSAGGALTVRF